MRFHIFMDSTIFQSFLAMEEKSRLTKYDWLDVNNLQNPSTKVAINALSFCWYILIDFHLEHIWKMRYDDDDEMQYYEICSPLIYILLNKFSIVYLNRGVSFDTICNYFSFTWIPVKLALWCWIMGGRAVYNIPFYAKYPAIRIHGGL